MENMVELAKEINKVFASPFLPDGFVQARITKDGALWLDIGDRNGEFGPDGKFWGSGTYVGEAEKWLVRKKK